MKKITQPSVIESAGNKIKIIEEFVGNVNTNTPDVSIARMNSPEGWMEPGQTPDFNEYTLILKGSLKVETRDETLIIRENQAVITQAGEWVRYSTPEKGGAEYLSVCLQAFSPDTVHRDEE